MIVTAQHEDVSHCIIHDMGRAVTLLNGEGAYKREKTMVLYCVVSRLEVTKVKEAVRRVDPHSFISIFDINEAHGGLFKRRSHH